jgi:PAS domain S-box-containing protein
MLMAHSTARRKVSAPLPAASRRLRIATPRPLPAAAIPASRSILGVLFDATLDAIVLVDRDGCITAWNRQAEAIFGWTAAEAIGQALGDLIVPERLRARHTRGLARAARTGTGSITDRRMEMPALRRSGEEFPAEVTITAVETDEHVAFAGFIRDLSRERLAEAARQRAEEQLAAARHQRAEIRSAMQALHARPTPEETAAQIASAISHLDGVSFVVIYAFGPDGALPLAVVSPSPVPTVVGRPIPTQRARYLRDSSTGPWIDEWWGRTAGDAYTRGWLEAGLVEGAYVPFGPTDEPYGLISAGTLNHLGREAMTGILGAVSEYAAVTAALLGPDLTRRLAQADVRGAVARIIDDRAFRSVYQPIVELESRTIVGYEALTRFADGTPPDRQFTDADRIGMAHELELVTLNSAFASSNVLPDGRWLSVNVSPGVLVELSHGTFSELDRPIVVEITERSAIEDYAEVRSALEALGHGVRLAVDDAGAGFASLRHIIELRPEFVKLDMRLVRGVEADAARQAMLAGMVFFAEQAGCTLIAEGIETEAERSTLQRLGVRLGQGYLLGRPEGSPRMR